MSPGLSLFGFELPHWVKILAILGLLAVAFYLLNKYYDYTSDTVEHEDLGMDAVEASRNSEDILPVLVDEIKRKYEDQNLRRETLENKISIIIALNGVIAAFVSASQNFTQCQKTILIGTAALSAILGILGLWPKEYDQPDTERHHLEFLDLDEKFALASLLNNYVACVENNQEINDRRFEIFEDCLFFTTISVFLLITFTLI